MKNLCIKSIIIIIAAISLIACNGGNSVGSSGRTFAYVNTYNNVIGSIFQCNVSISGALSGCIITPSSNSPTSWIPDNITFNVSSGVISAYVSNYGNANDSGNGNVYQCGINVITGALTTCTATAPGVLPTTVVAYNVTFNSSGGTPYAYVSDYSGNIYQCSINSAGMLIACSITPSSGAPIGWNPSGITFFVVGGTTYAYVSDFVGNIYQCNVTATGALTACGVTPSSGAPASWNPYAPIIFNAINGVTYAYVADFTGNVYKCNVNSLTGALSACVTTGLAPGAWIPDGITFNISGGVTYAYVADSMGGSLFQCNVLITNGALTNCAITGTPSGGWTPYGVSFLRLSFAK